VLTRHGIKLWQQGKFNSKKKPTIVVKEKVLVVKWAKDVEP